MELSSSNIKKNTYTLSKESFFMFSQKKAFLIFSEKKPWTFQPKLEK